MFPFSFFGNRSFRQHDSSPANDQFANEWSRVANVRGQLPYCFMPVRQRLYVSSPTERLNLSF